MAEISVDLVSADRKVWSGVARSVSAPSVNGQIGIMADHVPILAVLVPGKVHVTTNEGLDPSYQVSGGFLSFDNNLLTLVADEITPVTG